MTCIGVLRKKTKLLYYDKFGFIDNFIRNNQNMYIAFRFKNDQLKLISDKN